MPSGPVALFRGRASSRSNIPIARSLCAAVRTHTTALALKRFRSAIACRLRTLHSAGGCQQRVQFVNQKSCNTQLARTTSNTERRQWAAAATSSASPAARTACSVRGAASRPTLSMASTLADDARPPRHRRDPGKRVASQTLSMRRGALADASPRPNNAKTQAWSRASSANAATTLVWCGRTRSSRVLS